MRDPLDNGDDRTRPRLPLWIAIVSVIVAVASVSVLVLVLYEETKGPAEILREFAKRVDRGDCAGSYDLLDRSAWGDMTVDRWCEEFLPAVDASLDADFTLDQAVLEGDTAVVDIRSNESLTVAGTQSWELRRFGERSWRVVGPPGGLNVVPPQEA